MRLCPFWSLVGLARTVGIARSGNTYCPKVIDIFLTLGDDNAVASGNGLRHLVGAVDDLGVDALRALDPTIRRGTLKPKPRFTARRIADFAKACVALDIAVDVARQL